MNAFLPIVRKDNIVRHVQAQSSCCILGTRPHNVSCWTQPGYPDTVRPLLQNDSVYKLMTVWHLRSIFVNTWKQHRLELLYVHSDGVWGKGMLLNFYYPLIHLLRGEFAVVKNILFWTKSEQKMYAKIPDFTRLILAAAE